MEIVEFMQDNAISISTCVGAVAIICCILAKSYDKIVVNRDGTTLTLLKNPETPEKSTKFENVGNFVEVNNKKVTNHKKKCGDKISLKK